jgi:hypothetical protein
VVTCISKDICSESMLWLEDRSRRKKQLSGGVHVENPNMNLSG